MTQQTILLSGGAKMYLVDFFRRFMKYSELRGVKSFPAIHSRLWHDLVQALEQKGKLPNEHFIPQNAHPGSPELELVLDGLEFICDKFADFRICLKPGIILLKEPKGA